MATQASAYPRLSPSGLRVVAGDDVLVVDRTIELGAGIGGQFRDETSALYARQPDGALMLWREGHLPTLVREQGFNACVVAGERWIGWRAGEGLIWYDDVPWRGWHSPALSETRWAAILDIHPSKVLFAGRGDGRDGVRVAPSVQRQVDGVFARDPVLRGDLLTWVEEDQRTHEMSVWGQRSHDGPIENITIPGNTRQGYVVPVEIFGERWALSHDDARVYLYPWYDAAHGYVVAFAPAHRPDGRQQPEGVVRIVYDAEHNVLGDHLLDVRTEPRVDLRPVLTLPPERVPEGTLIDLLPFIVGEASTWPRDGSHYLHQTWDGRNLHLLKFGPMAEGSTFGDHWERWVLDGDQFYIREDRSQSGAGCYSIHPGLWFKRHMRVGESIDCSDAVLQRYDPKTCQVIDQHPLPYRLKLAEAWRNVAIGGILGVRDIVVCDSDPGGLHDTIERYWFARGAGLYQWRVTEQRDPSKTHTTSFTERGGPALTPTQGCWRRELVPWPPSLPKPPAPKPPDPPTPDPTPEPVMSEVSLQTFNRSNWIVAEDGGGQEGETAHGRPTGLARADRSAPGAWETFTFTRGIDGRVGFRAPNGGWLSAQPDGTLVFNRHRPDDWQPNAWEGFRVEGGLEGGVSLVTDHGTRVRAVNAGGGELRHDVREVAGIDETFFPSVPLTGWVSVPGSPVGGGAVGYLPPAGRVRQEGWSLADDHGPRPMLSVTLMDGETQFVRDRGRLQRNIEYCLMHGVDFVRTLSEVDWPGSEGNPRDAEQTVEATRFIWSMGMRVQLTIFGSHSHLNDAESERWTHEVCRALRDAGLEIALALVEIINEPGGAGWSAGRCQRHAAIVRQYLAHVPLAFGAPYEDGAGTTTGWGEGEEGSRAYRRFCEAPATIATPHFDRGINDAEGEYRICRQPYHGALQGFPFGNNEPSGPGASAQHGHVMRDPTMQRVHANGAWLQRAAFHCWHPNAGVGLNTDSLLESEPGLPGLSAVRAILPGDIANFSIKNWHWGDNPVESLRGVRDGNRQAPVRTHGLINGGRVVLHILGNDFGADLRARSAMRLTRYSWDGSQYAADEELEVRGGQPFFAPPAPDQIYVGRFI